MLYFNWFLQGNALWMVNPYAAKLHFLVSKPLFLICQLFFCILLLRGLLSYRKDETLTQKSELCFFVAWLPLVMFLLTHAGYRHLYIERYLFLILPFFLIGLVRGAVSFSSGKTVIVYSSAAVVLGVVSYGALLYKSDTWTVYKQNADWRSAAHYFITRNIPAKDTFILATAPTVELEYYFRKEERASPLKILPYEQESFEIMLRQSPVKAFYLIKNNYWLAGADKLLRRLRDDKRFESINSQSFKGLGIHRFVFRARSAASGTAALTSGG